jgi:hypothetical protein
MTKKRVDFIASSLHSIFILPFLHYLLTALLLSQFRSPVRSYCRLPTFFVSLLIVTASRRLFSSRDEYFQDYTPTFDEVSLLISQRSATTRAYIPAKLPIIYQRTYSDFKHLGEWPHSS